jgi:serine/threonine protein kinase
MNYSRKKDFFKLTKHQIQAETYKFEPILKKITLDELIKRKETGFEKGQSVLWLLALAAEKGHPEGFTLVISRFTLPLNVLTAEIEHSPPQKPQSILSILDKTAHEHKLNSEFQGILNYLGAFSTFEIAQAHFSANPHSVKLPKITKYTGNSYININSTLYEIGNRWKDPDVLLGEGSFGKVKVIKNQNKEQYKVKIEGGNKYDHSPLSIGSIKSLNKLIGIAVRTFDKLKQFKQKLIRTKTYTVSPLIYGVSLDKILNNKTLELEQRLIIAIKILLEVDHLHYVNRFIHADLKPANIIVNLHSDNPHNIEVSLTDFDLSIELPNGRTEVKKEYSIGTKLYQAPEVSQGIYATASDIYSLGVLFARDLELNEEFSIPNINNTDRKNRPSLAIILDHFVKKLEQRNTSSQTIVDLITLCRKKITTSGQTMIYNSARLFSFSSQYDYKNVPMKMTRTECSWRTFPEEGVVYNDKDWVTINSKVNFVNSQNRHWVSIGSNREFILFDMDSLAMEALKLAVLIKCHDKSINDILKIISNTVYKINSQITESTSNIEEQLLKYIASLPKIDNRNYLMLDDLIEKGYLVCRHKALIAVNLLSSLVDQGVLPMGLVHQYRSELYPKGSYVGAHAWAVFHNQTDGKIWVCDPTLNHVFDGHVYTNCLNFDIHKQQADDMGYGAEVLAQMCYRLTHQNIALPFFNALSQQKNCFPIIQNIEISENNGYAPYLNIIMHNDLVEEKHPRALMRALKEQDISAWLQYNDSIRIGSITHFINIDMEKLVTDYNQFIRKISFPFTRKQFSLAAQRGELETLQKILESVPNVIQTRTIGTAATRAFEYGKTACWQYLLPKCSQQVVEKITKSLNDGAPSLHSVDGIQPNQR